MKLALLYSGPYRATKDIVDNHIETFGSDIDIYVSCFEHYLDEWKASEFKVKEYFITPKINFNDTNWSKYRNDGAGQSGFWQFWNIRSVINQIPKNYDFYIKNRNDLVFHSKIDFNSLNLQNNKIYSPSSSFHKKHWNTDSWINDEFFIGCENTMNVVANFTTEYYNKNNRHSLNYREASNESQLRIHLKENNIDVQLIENFKYGKNHFGCHVPSGLVGFQLEK